MAERVDLASLLEPRKKQEDLVRAVTHDGVRKISVREKLSSDQQQILVDLYPEFDLHFLSLVNHQHAFPAVSRRLELQILLGRVGYTPSSVLMSGYDDYVCDIGGEYTVHLMAERQGIHSCCPTLDVRDCVRSVNRREQLLRFVHNVNVDDLLDTRRANLVRDFVNNVPCVVNSYCCNLRAQDCLRTARYGIALHSSYDIDLKGFSDIMIRKDMYEIYGSFIYSDMVFVEKEGIIGGLDAFYSIDESRGVIEFSFKNDSSLVYSHSLKSYFSLLTLNSFCADNGDKFVVELLENRGGVQFFKIVRLKDCVVSGNSLLSRFLWLPMLANMTKVNFFDIDYDKIACGDFKNAFPKVTFYVDTTVVDKVMAHAYASTESKFRPTEIFNFLLAYNGRIFFGSDVCVRNKQLPIRQAMMLANAVYIDVFVKKYDIGKVNQLMMNCIRYDRELAEASFVGKLFKGFFTPSQVLGTGHSTWRVLRTLGKPWHSFLWWWKKSRYNRHDFLEETVKFVRCDTTVSRLVFPVFRRDDRSVLFEHHVPVSQVLVSDASVDLRRLLTGILADFYDSSERQVVSLSDHVPRAILSDGPFEDTLPESFAQCLEELSRVEIVSDVNQKYVSFCAVYDFLLKSTSTCDLSVVGKTKVILCVTSKNVVLVNELLSKCEKLYVYGFDLSLCAFLDQDRVSNCVFLESTVEFCDGVVAAFRTLAVNLAVLDDDFRDLDRVYISLCLLVSSKQDVVFRLSPRLQFSTFLFLLCHVPYEPRGFGVNFCVFYLKFTVRQDCRLNVMHFSRDLVCFLKVFGFDGRDDVLSGDVSDLEDCVTEDSGVGVSECTFRTVGVSDAKSGCDSSSSFCDSDCRSESVFVGEIGVVDDVSDSTEYVSAECGSLVGGEWCESFSGAFRMCDIADRHVQRIRSFCESLIQTDATVRPSRQMGKRLEWLFGPTDYSYSGITTRSSSPFLPRELDGLYDDCFYNTLLVVYYPQGTRGLNFHRDNEPEMDSERVFTLSSGADCVLSLRDGKVSDFRITERNAYEFVRQDRFMHAVEVCGPRYALTFRRFKVFPGQVVNCSPVEVMPLSCGDYRSDDADRVLKHLGKDVFYNTRKKMDLVGSNVVVCRSEVKLIEMLPYLSGSTALDLCAAPGGFSYVLDSVGYEVTAVCLEGVEFRVPTVKCVRSDIFEFKTDGLFDVIVADGAPLDGLETDAESSVRLMTREYQIIKESLKFDGRAVLKLIIAEEVVPLLDSITSEFKFVRVLRPKATRAISREFYVLFGEPAVVEPFGRQILRGLSFVRLLAASSFLRVSSGATCNGDLVREREEFSRIVEGKVKIRNIAVPGDGNCLFYSLCGGDLAAARFLRKYIYDNCPAELNHVAYSYADVREECSADGVWAGVSTVLAFCVLFYSSVEIVENGVKIFSYSGSDIPLYSVVLEYKNSCHYERINSCVLNGVATIPFSVKPINVVGVLDVVNKIFSEEPAFCNLFGLFGVKKNFCLFGSKENSCVFYNMVNSLCFSVGCDCLHGLRNVLSECKRNGTDDLMVLAPLEGLDLERFQSCLDEVSVGVRALVLPGLAPAGVFLLLFSFRDVTKSVVALSEVFESVSMHGSVCEACSGVVIQRPPFYNHVNRTYFCCRKGDMAVSFVEDFVGTSVVFQLYGVTASAPAVDVLVRERDVVRMPVRFRVSGVLSESSGDLKRMRGLVERFFEHNGTFPCIGIENCGLVRMESVINVFRPFVSRILVKSGGVVVSPGGVSFSPAFVPSTGDESFIVNALVESREYYRALNSSIVSNLSSIHSQYVRILSNPESTVAVGAMTNNRPDFGLIDMQKGRFVISPKDGGGPYQYAFNGNKLVNISSAFVSKKISRDNYPAGQIGKWLKPGCFRGLFSVTKETKLINSHVILDRLSSFELGDLRVKAEINLIEGVPGCGKTHYIIENHNFSLSDTEHVVLTSSREAAEDLRRRVARKFKCDSEGYMMRRRYRTVDSFLMHYNSRDYNVSVIWLDEGLMKHFGDVLWCAVVSGCSTLNIIGDRAQIPFVNRVAGVVLNYSKILLSAARLNTTFLGVTHRCPADVAVYLNRFSVYSDCVRSSSSVMHSVTSRIISSVAEVSRGGDVQYLTFTQNERNDVSKALGVRVFTVHEFQGNQAENVVLVRINPKDIDIYKQVNYILVGISRHTKSFSYCTVVDDFCHKFLSNPVSLSEVRAVSVVDSDRKLAGAIPIYGCRSLDLHVSSKLKGGGIILGKTITKQFPMPSVTPRAAVMLDLLKQNGKIRDFVQSNLGHGVVPMRVNVDPVEIPVLDLPFSPSFYVSDPIVTMQHFYDTILPGHSVLFNSYDDKIFCQDELYFSTKEMLRFSEFEKFGHRRYDFLTPCLRTSCPTPISNDLKQVLKAFYDRNGNVPVLQGLVDEEAMAQRMFDSFVECYVGDKELFRSFSENPITVNVDSIEDWLFTQPKKVFDTAFEQEFWSIFNRELNHYSLILKKLPKPKLESNAIGKYPSPQTIAHQSKDVNAVFCPIIREAKKRLLSVLKNNVVIFSDVSVSDFEEILTVRFPARKLREFFHLLEIDMGKYDKSQNRLTLLHEIKLLVALGFPVEFVPTWIHMHVYTRLFDHINKFSARVLFQRKSGDPMTFFGNTVFLMACLAVVLDPYDFCGLIDRWEAFCLFSGDDSLLFLKFLLDLVDLSGEFANIFNLESKLLKYSTPYFCSKFLFMTPWGKWVVVPDVLKLLTKLGRSDLVNMAHVDEYRISCLDVARHLGNSLLYPLIDACMCDRYKLLDVGIVSLSPLYSAMFKCFSDKDVFRKLYFVSDGSLIDEARCFVKLNDF